MEKTINNYREYRINNVFIAVLCMVLVICIGETAIGTETVDLFGFINPAATPTCPPTGIHIDLNQEMYKPGDHFVLTVTACNGTMMPLPVVVFLVLDVYGQYYFWPSWSQFIDYEMFNLPPCDCVTYIILDFIWSAGMHSAAGIMLCGALTDPDMTRLYGSIECLEFGWF